MRRPSIREQLMNVNDFGLRRVAQELYRNDELAEKAERASAILKHDFFIDFIVFTRALVPLYTDRNLLQIVRDELAKECLPTHGIERDIACLRKKIDRIKDDPRKEFFEIGGDDIHRDPREFKEFNERATETRIQCKEGLELVDMKQ